MVKRCQCIHERETFLKFHFCVFVSSNMPHIKIPSGALRAFLCCWLVSNIFLALIGWGGSAAVSGQRPQNVTTKSLKWNKFHILGKTKRVGEGTVYRHREAETLDNPLAHRPPPLGNTWGCFRMQFLFFSGGQRRAGLNTSGNIVSVVTRHNCCSQLCFLWNSRWKLDHPCTTES